MKNRGQMGLIGEDTVSLIIIILALSGFLMFTNTLFGAHISENTALNLHRRAWTTADVLSFNWAYTDHLNITHPRLIDTQKICINCPTIPDYTLSVTVKDLRENKELCNCGPSLTEYKTARLPVALRFNYTKTHPGTIEVRIKR